MVREAQLKFTRESPGSVTIRSVADDGIHINDQVWSESVAITAEEVVEQWRQVAIADLVADDFAVLLEHTPELVIIGTGVRGQFPPRELSFAFARRGVGLEFMDTAAAARTFNVLVGEGRRVAAVLYPI